MKAIIYTKYGGPEKLQWKEIAKPVPNDDQVLVKVHAVSINDWDWGLLHGDPINRIMFGFWKPKKQILGSDIAGIIETVGKNVTRFKPGDEVFGDLSGKWGGFAEYVCANERSIALKSPGMTFEQAAAIPQAAMLAVQGLIDKAKIQQGQKILLNGAGGGVGTFAIQIAKQYGAEITAVDSADKLDMLLALGADHVIDYRREDFTKSGNQYDLILDVKTNRSVFDIAKALKPGGTYTTVGGSMRRLFQALIAALWIKFSYKKNIGIVALKPNKDLIYMNELFESGKVKPIIDGHYRLEDTVEAMRYYGSAEHKGKVVISVIHTKEMLR
jgi:NADPH:quinone reductase-like Zn-dependent oxidoreductase